MMNNQNLRFFSGWLISPLLVYIVFNIGSVFIPVLVFFELVAYFIFSLFVLLPAFLVFKLKNKTNPYQPIIISIVVAFIATFVGYCLLYAGSENAFVNGVLLVEGNDVTLDGYRIFIQHSLLNGIKAGLAGLLFWLIGFYRLNKA